MEPTQFTSPFEEADERTVRLRQLIDEFQRKNILQERQLQHLQELIQQRDEEIQQLEKTVRGLTTKLERRNFDWVRAQQAIEDLLIEKESSRADWEDLKRTLLEGLEERIVRVSSETDAKVQALMNVVQTQAFTIASQTSRIEIQESANRQLKEKYQQLKCILNMIARHFSALQRSKTFQRLLKLTVRSGLFPRATLGPNIEGISSSLESFRIICASTKTGQPAELPDAREGVQLQHEDEGAS